MRLKMLTTIKKMVYYFRQVINIIDEIDFTEYKERHEFGTIYESFLKTYKVPEMQGNSIRQELLQILW